MLDTLVRHFQLFLLLLARILAMVEVAPLLSSQAIPQMARIGLALFLAVLILPWVQALGYPIPEFGLQYGLLVLGEALVGVILGFYLNMIFAAFQAAGQFFSLQMGFGASEVFDPLAEEEIPLIGQFMNLIAMFTFLSILGFQKLLMVGVMRSFRAIRAVDLVLGRGYLMEVLLQGLARLFEQALMISFPILGTLLLVSVTMGLLAKAAPQMNLLMMGFPAAIGIAYIMIILAVPFLVSAFGRIMDGGIEGMARIVSDLKGARP